jgi:succinate-semialdehyde dehydrogenase/glutarate-semialdehyde dehydrogenase
MASVFRTCVVAGTARPAFTRQFSRSALAANRVQVAPFALKHHTGYINGQWTPAKSGAVLEVHNPATGGVVATVSDQRADETNAAVAAARAAFPGWSSTTAAERSALLRRMFDAMNKNADGLAALLTLESGKPFEEAKGEIAYAASFFEWFSEEAKRQYGDIIPPPRADRRILALRQPFGVAVRRDCIH